MVIEVIDSHQYITREQGTKTTRDKNISVCMKVPILLQPTHYFYDGKRNYG